MSVSAAATNPNFLSTSIGSIPTIERRVTPKCKLLNQLGSTIPLTSGTSYLLSSK